MDSCCWLEPYRYRTDLFPPDFHDLTDIVMEFHDLAQKGNHALFNVTIACQACQLFTSICSKFCAYNTQHTQSLVHFYSIKAGTTMTKMSLMLSV